MSSRANGEEQNSGLIFLLFYSCLKRSEVIARIPEILFLAGLILAFLPFPGRDSFTVHQVPDNLGDFRSMDYRYPLVFPDELLVPSDWGRHLCSQIVDEIHPDCLRWSHCEHIKSYATKSHQLQPLTLWPNVGALSFSCFWPMANMSCWGKDFIGCKGFTIDYGLAALELLLLMLVVRVVRGFRKKARDKTAQ